MGVGLYLTGTFPSDAVDPAPEEWLDQVAAWLESHEEEPLMCCQRGENESQHPTLFVQVHPCGEDVEISVPETGLCLVSAKTSTVGPGYHIFLCERLHELGEHFQIDWDTPGDEAEGDETGYFFHEDALAVRQEMLRWLGAVAGIVVENVKDGGDANVRMVSMPMTRSYPDETGILTPIGPRSTAWFQAVAAAPEHGIPFFPWWPEGVGSAFFLGRALCRLWQDVRWRTPITDDEGELLMDVHFDLERAFHIDPQSAIPWRAWHELLGYINEYFGYAEFQHEATQEGDIARRAQEEADASAPRVGYRRGRVNVTLTGGWSITIPGEFAEEWEENGETWSAWLGGRTIWFTSWSVCGENDETLNAREILDSRSWPDAVEFIDHAEGALLGRAVFLPCEEDGRTLWNLKGYVAVEGNFALCNIYVQHESDREWALDVWKSLRN
jgi:hypothetical protein